MESTLDEALSEGSYSEQKVLNNELLLGHILSHIEDPRTLRLVHPLWNDTILSNRKPRVWIRVPLKGEQDASGMSYLPIEGIKNVDCRLVRKMELSEEFVEGEFPIPSLHTSNYILQCTTCCTNFSQTIENLRLCLTKYGNFQPFILLILQSCPNLKMMEMDPVDIPFDYYNPDDVPKDLLPALKNTKFEVKPKMEVFNFLVTNPYRMANETHPTTYPRLVQSILDVAPNLTSLSLKGNFIPRLEKQQRNLKTLTWELLLAENNHSQKDAHYSEDRYPDDRTFPSDCYQNYLEFLQGSQNTLEVLEIRFSNGNAACRKCRKILGTEHMPPLVLPNLTTLTIVNPNAFMLQGGHGFSHFSREILPKLETLEFQGETQNWGDFQLRVVELQKALPQFRDTTNRLNPCSENGG